MSLIRAQVTAQVKMLPAMCMPDGSSIAVAASVSARYPAAVPQTPVLCQVVQDLSADQAVVSLLGTFIELYCKCQGCMVRSHCAQGCEAF
jgi:hypothetical protein